MPQQGPNAITAQNPGPVSWHISKAPVDYAQAQAFMLERARQIAAGNACELVWLLQHDSIYTAGTSARLDDLHDPERFPVIKTGRGGQYTYHGPGQRVVYLMLDLHNRGGRDVRKFIDQLHTVAINTLNQFGVRGQTRDDRVGIWVPRIDKPKPTEDKIVAVGIRLNRWVSLHGFSLNVDVDLSHYDGIKPCGIEGFGVTSLKDLGVTASMRDVDRELKRALCTQFATTIIDAPKTDPVKKFP